MFDTPVTIVGNVLTTPEWRRTANTGTMLVTFKVASTSRKYNRASEQWVDGASLRVRVACWRKLGENVSLSLQLGDPVIVYGRIYSRDWTDDAGNKRTSYELDALAVGHDLARGVGKFARRRAPAATDMLNDETGAVAIGGELTEVMDDPDRPEDLPPDNELFENFDGAIFAVAGEPDTEEESETASDEPAEEPALAGAAGGPGGGAARSRGGSRSRAGSARA
jgi:single-strand DNA-binding protein